ncbi:hypothetical protein [Delftia tsuruhatensis]|uniref:hypothetical protein n=1 Tax=Delftia tsuruhatensis TaxID=180282 RepID=UPI0012AA81CB|nr:hypothetical protein [Delftia tsuruhatensis]QFS64813.1 hypothetical protein GCS91_11075 [Delftia tsuruhatensis]
MKKMVALAFFAMASQLTFAEVAVSGAGASQKCGDWVAARSEQSKSIQDSITRGMIGSWVQGYLSGINAAEVQSTKRWAFDIPSSAVLDGLLDKTCKDDPLKDIFSAAIQISVVLRQRSPMP